MRIINVRLSDTFGCNIVATAILQSLRDKFPDAIINVYTKYPDLIFGLNEIDKIIDLKKECLKNYNVDFKDYLKSRKPQESMPFRHLISHMFEVAESQLSVKLNRNFKPKINLTEEEMKKAEKIVKSLSHGKPLIWLQTKTSEKKKDMPAIFWKELIKKENNYEFVDLSSEVHSRRISIAITKLCNMGVTLDTFLLHCSGAVKAKNVIAIMVSSHKEVVTYPNQIVIQGSIENWKETLKELMDKIKLHSYVPP